MKPIEALKLKRGYSAHEVLIFLCNPEFAKADRIHNWRNYVPDEIIMLWDNLGEEARMVAYVIASEQADKEWM